MSSPLADLIQRGESGRTNYNAYNRGTYVGSDGREHVRGSDGPLDFSSMTVGQVMDAQSLPNGDAQRLFAVGRYQVIPVTMARAVSSLELDRSDQFSNTMQDRIFSDYLISDKRPDVRNYIVGVQGSSLQAAQKALSQEWASVANPDTGKSYYDKPGGANHASISAAETAQALNVMRDLYTKAIQSGSSPDDAWRQINSQPAQQLSAPSHSQRAEPMADGKLEPGERGDAVKHMQGQLAQLGLTGRDGKPLHPDGDFGPNTRYAVEQFQREHGLGVDGVVGRNTRAALDQAVAQHAPTQQTATPQSAAVAAAPLLSDPSHPQHALYSGSVRQLEKLGERGGFANRQALEQTAGQMAFEAKVSGLDRIDYVLPNKDGRGLIAIQGELNDPAMCRVYVDREQAQVQPLQESTRQMAEEVQRQSQAQQGEARAPAAMTR
ncbi:peptidoglycan-binding domain-containing protein [Xanthomonas translucens]|nr:peptidoglycan-binding domain-containing protein [Xanthomonas translucens]MCC8445008.1 peptidoglycan-binding protein [Xanthomonas translucens pv. translucens]MCT8287701.1 peptidoglycan-binding protein [Xanthomonas translucens pv. translucens]MCT8305359.1 peptidoglycan-binding protein [Xanthomonas translucens pv. translucens]